MTLSEWNRIFSKNLQGHIIGIFCNNYFNLFPDFSDKQNFNMSSISITLSHISQVLFWPEIYIITNGNSLTTFYISFYSQRIRNKLYHFRIFFFCYCNSTSFWSVRIARTILTIERFIYPKNCKIKSCSD